MRNLASAALIALIAGGMCSCGISSAPAGRASHGPGGSAAPARSGRVTGSAQPTGPTPSPSAGAPGILTVADSGATVRLSLGQSVTVTLGPHSPFSWHVPAVTGTAVRRTSSGGGYPGHEPARATFLAVRPGRAVLSAVDDAACLHAQPSCMLPQQSWRVVVIVARSSS